ncbi:Hypothetical Protein FCC1311_042632 [Hondaea fermentalgiana]|uniref:PH domain-containing protein n=1 Tax=Hondaea fermentalgiana TaxID=2315210 RepID=A0A2R5GAL1_9STRA|nr:Hypothetical Protein FCC1311_042632 [Hondaea fermentalgiana]|eukprot:GBG28040.1 Hypothetical Protein FCC1311_042632 [Hondaea fermentalgiana]
MWWQTRQAGTSGAEVGKDEAPPSEAMCTAAKAEAEENFSSRALREKERDRGRETADVHGGEEHEEVKSSEAGLEDSTFSLEKKKKKKKNRDGDHSMHKADNGGTISSAANAPIAPPQRANDVDDSDESGDESTLCTSFEDDGDTDSEARYSGVDEGRSANGEGTRKEDETNADTDTVVMESNVHKSRAAAALGFSGTLMRAKRSGGSSNKYGPLVVEFADKNAGWIELAKKGTITAVCCVGNEVQVWTRSNDKHVVYAATADEARDWMLRLSSPPPPNGTVLRNVVAWPDVRHPDDFGLGDIVMFRISQTIAGLQRALTGSPWDHTGIVVPSSWGMTFPCGYTSEEEPWMLVEATPDGVISCPLGRRIEQYRQDAGARACVRQLRHAKDGSRLGPGNATSDLAHLVTACLGAPYSYAKVVNVPSTPFEYVREHEEVESASGYFCSELCARALMCMRVLDGTKHHHPNAYWPKSFVVGQEVDRQLDSNYTLSPELPVDLTHF